MTWLLCDIVAVNNQDRNSREFPEFRLRDAERLHVASGGFGSRGRIEKHALPPEAQSVRVQMR